MQPIKNQLPGQRAGWRRIHLEGKQETSHRDHILLDLSSLVKDLGICFSERDRQQGKAVSGAVFRMEDLPRTRTGARGRIWEARWGRGGGPCARWWGRCGGVGALEATGLCWFGKGRSGGEHERCEAWISVCLTRQGGAILWRRSRSGSWEKSRAWLWTCWEHWL